MPGSACEVVVDSIKQFNCETISRDEVSPVSSLGENLRVVKRETLNFSKEFATELLEMTQFGPDRALNDGHVNTLLSAMKQGTFRWEQVIVSICKHKGKFYRMNGQHTAWARLYFDKNGNFPVQVLTYNAASEGDMRMLYSSIDRNKPRSRADVINSYLFGSDKFVNMSKRLIKQIAEGFSFWHWGNGQSRGNGQSASKRHTADEVSFLLQTEFYGLTLKVAKFLEDCQNKSSRHLMRSPVYAAMFASFEKNEDDSVEFWTSVCDGVSLGANDPRLKLRNHLLTHAVNAGRGGGSYKNNVNGDDMYGWCIQAWNAFRNEKELKTFRACNGNRLRAD